MPKKKEAHEAVHEDESLPKIISEIISLERRYYFEKKNVNSERQRKIKEIIERHTPGEA